jgi:flavorubredoxin
MAVVQIKDNVYWVGAIDWNDHDFHGYSTAPKGTTYNAYLVIDDKITLFDTVKEEFKMDLYHQIRSLVKLEDIDYIVANHMEPDHSGALPWIMEQVKPEKLFCSKMGKKALLELYHHEKWPYEVVGNGDSISLGKKTVHFMETRMVHWPDSMFSYIPQDKLLISQDAFGQNLASVERFDDEVDLEALMDETSFYYANIVLPYSPQVRKVFESLGKSGWEIDMIAPDHGVVWRSHVDKILEAYDRYSRQVTKEKAVIVYDTMWHSTEKMAKAIGEGLSDEGVSYTLMHLKAYHHSQVMGELADATALICGSSTHNNGILPLVADFLTYMKGLRPVGRLGAAFGSYGWSGESVKHISDFMESAKIEMVGEGVRVRNRPTHEDLAACRNLGRDVGKAIKTQCAADE